VRDLPNLWGSTNPHLPNTCCCWRWHHTAAVVFSELMVGRLPEDDDFPAFGGMHASSYSAFSGSNRCPLANPWRAADQGGFGVSWQNESWPIDRQIAFPEVLNSEVIRRRFNVKSPTLTLPCPTLPTSPPAFYSTERPAISAPESIRKMVGSLLATAADTRTTSACTLLIPNPA